MASGQRSEFPCASCAEWNTPQEPFKIFGNTYYVGPHGLSSVLITSPAGHILIDGGLPESAPLIVANIRKLGFHMEDVKLILSSHVHFDHAGGIAELQRLSGALVVASKWNAKVLEDGRVSKADPQFGTIPPITPVKNVQRLGDGETIEIGEIAITGHLTPGHTPGGTSWTWQSCEGKVCRNMVFADSLSPASADGFKFSKNREYPRAVKDFEKSFAFLETAPCDVVITTHPDAVGLWDRVASGNVGAADPGACRQLAAYMRERLRQRLAEENKK